MTNEENPHAGYEVRVWGSGWYEARQWAKRARDDVFPEIDYGTKSIVSREDGAHIRVTTKDGAVLWFNYINDTREFWGIVVEAFDRRTLGRTCRAVERAFMFEDDECRDHMALYRYNSKTDRYRRINPMRKRKDS